MINTDRRIFNLMGDIMDLGRVRQNLSDAGCAEEISGDIMKMCKDGNLDRALLMMKKARCVALDELHRSGRKVDCLDFLIRNMEKEMNQADHRDCRCRK